MTSSTVSFPAGIPLGTKLNAPVGARRRIARELLVQRLASPEPRRLTLLAAPAGWGKTSLLAAWASDTAETRAFAWLTVDRTDNDPVRFWAYVIEALRALAPSVGSAPLAALGVSGTNPVEVFLPPLINELAVVDRRLVLVLDDYHLVESDDVHADVAFLLAHLPATLELAIATRIDPPLPLAHMRAQGELLELRAAELRFNEAEAEQLLRATVGEGLDAADVERLVVRTEGWAAGLYLAALSLAGRSDRSAFIQGFAGDDRHIVDYLGGEVLDELETETRAFLLRTSILERLSAQLCDHVLETSDARRRLLEIERANLFLVPLDGRREWYRYHHLFRDLLRQELESSDPDDVRALHRRAAEWLARTGALDDAIGHALAAGDETGAVRLVAEQWRTPFNRGELATVDRWLDDLPEAVVASDPDLCLARAWVLMDRGRAREAEQWLAGAEAGRDDLVPHAVLSFKLGRIGEAERIARDALESAGTESSLGLGVAHLIFGISLYYRGELEQAASSLDESIRLAVSGDNRLARIYSLGYLALIQLEQGDEEAARLAVADALELGGARPASEHFVTAAALLARGRLDGDEATLEQAVALARRGGAAVEIGAALLGLGRVRRDPAMLAEARATLAKCDDPGRLPALIQEAELSLRGGRRGPRLMIAGDLSDRELAVLRLLPGDASLREIAAALYVSLNTVKTHSRAIYRKLDASSRQEAVERGRELGLL